MVPLRRLGNGAMLALVLVLLAGGEALTGLALWLVGGSPTLPVALLLTGGQFGSLIVAYPLLPWLAVMMLGWTFGRWLENATPATTERLLGGAGLTALTVFVVLRGLNGYGNLLLPREDASLVQWLHVSKYPPALSYVTLELGIMAVVLAGFIALERRGGRIPWLEPLRVLGQTALFFYLLHVHVLTLAAHALGLSHAAGLGATYCGALFTLVVLYPLCLWYGGYKRAHPDGWPRYV